MVCVFKNKIILYRCVLSILASINHDGVMFPLAFRNLLGKSSGSSHESVFDETFLNRRKKKHFLRTCQSAAQHTECFCLQASDNGEMCNYEQPCDI